MKPLSLVNLSIRSFNFAKDGKMLDSDNEVAETFNSYLCNIAHVISSKNHSSVLMESSMITEDPVESAKFNNHPSVKFINNTFNNAGASFSFQYVSLDETSK